MDGPERIRVLRIVTRLNIGGPALHTVLLTERLDPRRYESRLVAGREGPTEGSFLALHGRPAEGVTRVPALGPQRPSLADARALVELVRLMRRMRPHIVHTHTAKAGALGRLAARLTEVPVLVHTFHGHVFRGYFSRGPARLFLAVERALARRTDCLLAVSETVRRELLALSVGTPERFRVVALGLDLAPLAGVEALEGSLRAELGLPAETPLVGIVARLVPIKAHEIFLRAAVRVAHAFPAARFLVVGDGERRTSLERMTAELGLSGRVRFLGWRADLGPVYADLDVVAMTSRNEGSPVSVIEAMAAARPVVATAVGGVVDLVEDGVTGYLVPPDNPEALARALTAVLVDPARRRAFGKAGRERVLPAYVTERLVGDIDRLYGELLRAKGLDCPG